VNRGRDARALQSTSLDARSSDHEEPQLVRHRLALFGKVMTVMNFLFFVGFQLLWSGEPSVGAARAWRTTLSPGSIGVALVYLATWLVPLARPWGRRGVRAIDLIGASATGAGFAAITFAHPVAAVSIWEVGLATTAILALRALLVPSSPRITALVGVLVCAPSVVLILSSPERFAGALSARTVAMLVTNRSLVAIGTAAVASSVLYGLRRQVREARRLGQYTLEERLGQGGMGVVYRARHAMLRRPTAIKLLRPHAGASIERFESEVQLMARLSHPNTVAVHDYGRTADGVFYYAMEYLDGLDLQQLAEIEGPLPGARVIYLLRQACGALAEAHAAGLIHRDVKPANIFACRARTIADLVKVLDFGLVKDLGTDAPDVTVAGALVGTPLYVAPELITRATPADARTDLYSLGAVAYRLLTGVTVFEGRTSMEVCAHHLHTSPTPARARADRPLAADLEAVVMRCLEKDPGQRFADADQMAAALDACADAGAWTQARARAWWTETEPRIEAWRQRHVGAPSDGADSVVVDHRGRSVRSA
jgi:hypothetical protein